MSDISGYKPQSGGIANRNGGDLTDKSKFRDDDLKGKATEFTDTVVQTAKDQLVGLSTAAKDMANDATGKVKTALNDQKAAGADYIGNIAQAVHRAAGEFDGDVPQAAQYIRQAAAQLDSVANSVRERDMGELIGDVRQFARRQPTLFFGGALILGFAALRFFKSSSPDTVRGYASGPSEDSPSSSGDKAYAQNR